MIHTQIGTSPSKQALRLSDNDLVEVIAGRRALEKSKMLSNNGAMKRMLNGYIRQKHYGSDTPRASYKRREFVPFVEERDHLGQLIDSDMRTELGTNGPLKRVLVKRGGRAERLEIREDVPGRWLEKVGSATEFSATHSPRASFEAHKVKGMRA
jgi:hypothetical protein